MKYFQFNHVIFFLLFRASLFYSIVLTKSDAPELCSQQGKTSYSFGVIAFVCVYTHTAGEGASGMGLGRKTEAMINLKLDQYLNIILLQSNYNCL